MTQAKACSSSATASCRRRSGLRTAFVPTHDTLELMLAAPAATVSACRLSHEAMGSPIGPLIRSEPCYADLRLEWIVWPSSLHDLETRGGTFVVEFSTPRRRAVTVIEHGRWSATFADPTQGSGSWISSMALPPEVWGPDGSSDQGAKGSESLAQPSVALTVSQPQRDPVEVKRPAPADRGRRRYECYPVGSLRPVARVPDQNPELPIDGIPPSSARPPSMPCCRS